MSGGVTRWNAPAVCVMFIHDSLANARTAHEKRYEVTSDGLVTLCGAEVTHKPMTPKDEARMHQFGIKMLRGIFMGYAQHA